MSLGGFPAGLSATSFRSLRNRSDLLNTLKEKEKGKGKERKGRGE